jgi:hypothetical protein
MWCNMKNKQGGTEAIVHTRSTKVEEQSTSQGHTSVPLHRFWGMSMGLATWLGGRWALPILCHEILLTCGS